MRRDIKRKSRKIALLFFVAGFVMIVAIPPAHQAVSKRLRPSVLSGTAGPLAAINGSVAPTTIASAVTLSPPSINFGYQLVGTPGAAMTETINNFGNTPVTITDISFSGRDHDDFSCDSSLPLTVAQGSSIPIHFSFRPALPWRAGTREATAKLKLKGKERDAELPLTGIGATCSGPVASCSSGCVDADDDGLNDAWEIAGGIDINNDGSIDSTNDVLLPGADPNKPDVYVKYDYMVATTTSPDGMPPHSHQPPAAAIQQVVDAFALHGVNLHIDPHHDAIPEAFVTTRDPNPTVACALNGNSGGGYNVVTMQALRQQYLGNRNWAYHYGVWAHSAVVPDTAPCCDGTCGLQPCIACASDPSCGGKPDPTSVGNADIGGANFILAFGTLAFNNGLTPDQIGVESYASIFMHELGHNFGLVHGSLAPSPDPLLTTSQQQCLAFKPNYVSVMSYLDNLNGILVAGQPGSSTPVNCNGDADCPANSHCTDDLGVGGNVCYRVDYSSEKLLDLNEASLNELLGVGGSASNMDLVWYCGPTACGLSGPAFGPIDWNHNGNAAETSVAVDIDGNPISIPNRILSTTTDWDKMNFKFQCAPAFATDSAAGASSVTAEPGLKELRERHALYLPAPVTILYHPECLNGSLAPSASGIIQVALLGLTNLDVNDIDTSSLSFHGARPVTITVQDVNDDCIPDLLLQFRGSDVHLQPGDSRVRLTGWLKNSRAFVGDTDYVSDCPR